MSDMKIQDPVFQYLSHSCDDCYFQFPIPVIIAIFNNCPDLLSLSGQIWIATTAANTTTAAATTTTTTTTTLDAW